MPRVDVNGDPLPPGALARIGFQPVSGTFSSGEPFRLYAGRKSSLASTSMDGFLCVWDSANGKLRWRIKMRCGDMLTIVGALTVSGDGKKTRGAQRALSSLIVAIRNGQDVDST